MQKIPITAARNKVMKLPSLIKLPKSRALPLLRRNKEVVAVMSWELYERPLET